VQAAVTFELSHNENNGHVFLPRDKLIAATVPASGLRGGACPAGAGRAGERKRRGLQRPVAGVDACYLRRLWEAETYRLRQAECFAGRLRRPQPPGGSGGGGDPAPAGHHLCAPAAPGGGKRPPAAAC
jgi:hypothetical protein